MKIAVIDNTGKLKTEDLEKNQIYWNKHVPKYYGFSVEYEYDFLDVEIKPDYSTVKANKYGKGDKTYFILSDKCVAEIGSKVEQGKYDGILYICERSKSDQWAIYKKNFKTHKFPDAHCHKKAPQRNVTLVHHNGVTKEFFAKYNHECHHEIDRHREWSGLKGHDVMDKTIVNGKTRFYYKNNDVFAKDGNRAMTLKGWIDDWDDFAGYREPLIEKTIVVPEIIETNTMYNLSKNYIPKHYSSVDKKYTVLHVDLGTYAGTVNHLKNTASASYHDYVMRDKKEIVNFVPLNFGAWHAGKVSNPSVSIPSGNPNRMSYGLCYSGKPVDKDGNITSDWNKAVDGQRATDEQVEMTAQRIIDVGMADLPIYAHVELTSYKPKIVLDFKYRVQKKIKEIQGVGQIEHICNIDSFTLNELIDAIIRKIRK